MTTVSRIGTLSLAGVLSAVLVAACGARTGLPVPPGDAGPDACVPADVPINRPVPNLYFVLDRSTSMNDENKWSTVRSVVSGVMAKLGPSARFGAAVFPDPLSDPCSPGTEVMSLRLGDTQGNVAAALLVATAMDPNGGTPTAATFRSLTPHLAALPGTTFAILATDGGPNCNPGITCGVQTCTANLDAVDPSCHPNAPPNCCDPNSNLGGSEDCLDDTATAAAVKLLHDAGVSTFVIGIPGSAPYDKALDEIATAGGTARPTAPFYYRVDTSDSSALEAALAQIAAKITGACTLLLDAPPPDPADVNVVIGGQIVPRDPVNGWSLSGSTVTLLGATCDRVKSGQGLDIQVTEGCPTVTQ